ncbi:hypothetical protein BFJ68_g4892 [Fusarium oxysporum]|jgi:hypothetical protein|uniref:Uncharacterized protein n=1 Tax=Fusarium oxysporum TaxID=5507 RepID=A0A420RIF5_FUSOX|nr:hypothetical protein BFJ71_g7152 [Fusarium oxysporum]RKL16804.1 hypothetical protein BFJ68_g4892 [Fusarium oxysporum]
MPCTDTLAREPGRLERDMLYDKPPLLMRRRRDEGQLAHSRILDDPGEQKPGGARRWADFGEKEKEYQRYHSLDISS